MLYYATKVIVHQNNPSLKNLVLKPPSNCGLHKQKSNSRFVETNSPMTILAFLCVPLDLGIARLSPAGRNTEGGGGKETETREGARHDAHEGSRGKRTGTEVKTRGIASYSTTRGI